MKKHIAIALLSVFLVSQLEAAKKEKDQKKAEKECCDEKHKKALANLQKTGGYKSGEFHRGEKMLGAILDKDEKKVRSLANEITHPEAKKAALNSIDGALKQNNPSDVMVLQNHYRIHGPSLTTQDVVGRCD